MPNGRNHNFEIQTRQKDDELFRFSDSVVPGTPFESAIRRVLGYGVIRFLAISNVPMILRVEESSSKDGPWVETVRVASAASTSGDGQQLICADLSPCGVFMRVFLDNVGGEAAILDFAGFGHPVAGGGSTGGGGGGGGIAGVVELEDGNGGVTRASVKVDGILIGAQGSVLVGGRDPNGFQRTLSVDAFGRLIISSTVPIVVSGAVVVTGAVLAKGSPGATITTDPDVAVGTGATVPLGAIPAGTRRFTVRNEGPAGTWVRVREVGGVAGSGALMPRLGEYTYGGADGAIAQLEVEDVSLAVGGVAVATSISVQYERD